MEALSTILKEVGQIIEYPLFFVNQKPITITSIIIGFIILLVFIFFSKGIRRIIKNKLFPKYKLDQGIQLAILKDIMEKDEPAFNQLVYKSKIAVIKVEKN